MKSINPAEQVKPSVSKNKRISLAILLFLPAVLVLALPYYKPGDVPLAILLIGRFHPVILHFPIVLIILALIMEVLRRVKILKTDFVQSVILVSSAISAIVAVASGFLLYASGDYSGLLLQQHLWIGVITGSVILITVAFFYLYKNNVRWYAFYVVALLISNGAVAYTSHLGGSLTHGEDYLTEYLPLISGRSDNLPDKSESEMTVYQDVIVPVFEAKCLSCHNENKSKGELSMTSFEKMVKGGETGNAGIVAGNAEKSEIYARVILPEDHEDRMPPKGKTPLTDAETLLLRFWIQTNAATDLRVETIRKDSVMNDVLDNVLPELKRYHRKRQIAAVRDERLKRSLDTLAKQLNISIVRDSAEEETLYAVAMKFPPAPFTNAQFRELAPFAGVFSRLSLVSSGIQDDGLYHIGHMKNVKALFLQKTRLDGSGLIHLRNLEKLEVLNLSFTGVEDKFALELLNIPNLREVYLYRTKTSPEVIRAMQEYRPGLKILMEEGPYF